MARGIIRLQEELHNRVLRLRSVEAIIHRPQFERLWSDASIEDQDLLAKAVEVGNRNYIRKWMAEHPSLELVEKPLLSLKEIAQRLGIVNTSRMGKLELVRAIKERENDYDSQ